MQVSCCGGVVRPQTVEGLHDALLHFCGGFVREGDGQYAAVGAWVGNEVLDIFNGQREGFSRTRRGFVHKEFHDVIRLLFSSV